jgi:hypothetical protein
MSQRRRAQNPAGPPTVRPTAPGNADVPPTPVSANGEMEDYIAWCQNQSLEDLKNDHAVGSDETKCARYALNLVDVHGVPVTSWIDSPRIKNLCTKFDHQEGDCEAALRVSSVSNNFMKKQIYIVCFKIIPMRRIITR